MFQITKNVVGLIGALALMGALAAGAFVLGRSNPSINMMWFFALAGVSYTMILLFALHRD